MKIEIKIKVSFRKEYVQAKEGDNIYIWWDRQMWPWIWAIVHISQSLLILNVIEKPLRVVSGVPEIRRNPSGLQYSKLVASFNVKRWP